MNIEIGELKAFLDALYSRFHTLAEVEHDPLRFPRRFSDPLDAQAAGFIAASFAFGRVDCFMRVLEVLFDRLGEHPAQTLARLEGIDEIASGLYYRFVGPAQIEGLLRGIGRLLRDEGGLENAFRRGLVNGTVGGIASIAEAVRSASHPDPGFLVSKVVPGNAAKRLNMFLRWMVRDDGIDLGLWHSITPASLLMPLDIHVFRIAQSLSLLPARRSQPRLADAVALTERLRELCPEDPVRYDFALSHLGISRSCIGVESELCKRCELRAYCRVTTA